jgi:NADH dehydrogenase
MQEWPARNGCPSSPAGPLPAVPAVKRLRRRQDRIFAVGDIAVIDGHPVPQLAQPALQMGRHAAEQIGRLAADDDPALPSRG